MLEIEVADVRRGEPATRIKLEGALLVSSLEFAGEHGQNTDKLKWAACLSGPKLLQILVAGGGFEPPTFGL